MTANYLVWSFLKPSHGLIFVSLVGFLLRGRYRRLGRSLLWVGVVGYLFAAFSPIGVWLIAPLEQRFPPPSRLGSVTGIIVLAGSEVPELTQAYGQPHVNDLSGRLLTTIRLGAAVPTATVVHSGERPFFVDEVSGERTNASDVAAEIFQSGGLAPERLVFERESENTCESARFTQELIDPESESSWLLMTSAAHMPRAVACFRAVGWEVVPYPTDYKQATGRGFSAWNLSALGNLRTLDLAAHEWIGLLYYRIAGRTDELFPGPRDDDGD